MGTAPTSAFLVGTAPASASPSPEEAGPVVEALVFVVVVAVAAAAAAAAAAEMAPVTAGLELVEALVGPAAAGPAEAREAAGDAGPARATVLPVTVSDAYVQHDTGRLGTLRV